MNYTGISAHKFEIIFEHLNPGSNSENIKFYETSKRTAEETIGEKNKDTSLPEGKNSGPKPRYLQKYHYLCSWYGFVRDLVKLIYGSWLFNIDPYIYSFTLSYHMGQLLIFLLG